MCVLQLFEQSRLRFRQFKVMAMHDQGRWLASGSCPCGKGALYVDKSLQQPEIRCVECSSLYVFYRIPGLSKARLVRKSSLDRLRMSRSEYEKRLREIENLPEFLELNRLVIARTRELGSRLRQFLLLKQFGLVAGIPLHKFDVSEFKLSGSQVWLATQMTGFSSRELDARWREADLCRLQSLAIPSGIPTGIEGLEM